jgi:transcriptional regulator
MAMFVPPHFAVHDRIAIARLMHDNAFATLVTPAQPEPAITHLPLMWLADCEPHGTLIGHFARANPHADLAEAALSTAIFHGPHAYVSPSWYADPAAGVPTWNYAVVHAHGPIVLAPDRAATQAVLDMLIQRFESTRPAPWQLALGPARLDAMVGAIVGFRMRIKRIDAKFKLSQNRSNDDRARVIEALGGEGYPDAIAAAAWMRAYAAPADGEG